MPIVLAPDIDEALSVLGTTTDDVAASLRRLEIRGLRRTPQKCPIAKYLRMRGFEVMGSYNHFIELPGGRYGRTAEVITQFMKRFDEGEFPFLDIEVQ